VTLCRPDDTGLQDSVPTRLREGNETAPGFLRNFWLAVPRMRRVVHRRYSLGWAGLAKSAVINCRLWQELHVLFKR